MLLILVSVISMLKLDPHKNLFTFVSVRLCPSIKEWLKSAYILNQIHGN